MSEALKHCPFCGGEAELTKYPDDTWYVTCKNENCNRVAMTAIARTKERAIELWNNRPSPWHTGKPTEKGKYYCIIDSEYAPCLILNWDGSKWIAFGTIPVVRTESVKKWQRIEP